MSIKNCFIAFTAFLFSSHLFANLSIYKAGTTLITGTWAANAPSTLTAVATDSPYEGNEHYKFSYLTSGTWAGFGLNLDNWNNGTKRNFSGYSHLRIAYRGLASGHAFRLKLRSGNNNFGNSADIGGSSGAYTVVDIPMAALVNVNGVLADAISEIDFEVISPSNSEFGTAFIDALELVNVAPPAPIANATCLERAKNLGKGFNTSNWLEAWWNIQWNVFPDPVDYTRAKFKELRRAGFTHVRLPVTFEQISNPNPPYNLITSNVAYRLIDSAITWANDFDFKLIIDNHHGYNITDDNYQTELKRKCAIWRQLMQRYGKLDPNRFLFEIYNEPNGISNANWKTVAQAVMDTVRAFKTNHTFIIGANSWNSMTALSSFVPLNDPNVIYTFHTYEPYFFTHQGMSWTSPANFPARKFPLNNEAEEIRSLFTTVKNWGKYYGVPIYMGEFGVSSKADATSRCEWVKHLTHLADSLQMPWAYWDAKNYNDAFGFYPGGIAEANIIPCFKTAMKLYQVPISAKDLAGLANAKNLSVFPNPISSNELNIKFDAEISENIKIKLIAANGQLMQNIDYQATESSNQIQLNFSDYPNGFYLIQVWTEKGEVLVAKVVKE